MHCASRRAIGSRPMPRMARTGELTPPTSDCLARAKSSLLRESETQPLVARLLQQARQLAAESPLSAGERYVLSLVRCGLVSGPLFGSSPAPVQLLTSLIQDGAVFYLTPGEIWSDGFKSCALLSKHSMWGAGREKLKGAE